MRAMPRYQEWRRRRLERRGSLRGALSRAALLGVACAVAAAFAGMTPREALSALRALPSVLRQARLPALRAPCDGSLLTPWRACLTSVAVTCNFPARVHRPLRYVQVQTTSWCLGAWVQEEDVPHVFPQRRRPRSALSEADAVAGDLPDAGGPTAAQDAPIDEPTPCPPPRKMFGIF